MDKTWLRNFKAQVRYWEREVAYWQPRHPGRAMRAYERLQKLYRSAEHNRIPLAEVQ